MSRPDAVRMTINHDNDNRGGACAAIHPVAAHVDGGIIICTRPMGHEGEHNDSTHRDSTGDVIVWDATSEDSTEARCGHLNAQGPDGCTVPGCERDRRYTSAEGGSLPATNPERPLGLLATYGDTHHGKYSDRLCHYVAEAHDGSIVGDAQTYECSDVDVDYYARIGAKRIYHVDSRGFHYLWKFADRWEANQQFETMTEHLRIEEADDDDGEGSFGDEQVVDWLRTHRPDLLTAEEATDRTLVQERLTVRKMAHRMGYRDGWYGLQNWSDLCPADAVPSYEQGYRTGAESRANGETYGD